MDNREIFNIAMMQSAIDINCQPMDFLKSENVIVRAEIRDKARKYYKEPVTCNMVSYGSNIVASVKDEYVELIKEYIGKFEFYHCFETPNMHWLNERFSDMGHKICFMAEYFLPDLNKLHAAHCEYDIKLLHHEDFEKLYIPQWSNALCEKRKELDVLGVGAYDGNKLIGLAACSADCELMWQIGIDVLPEYRKRGIASALTGNLAMEILKLGKVPFYCCAWSNLRSARTAIKSGFVPAWVEMTVKPASIVNEMNV